MLIRRRVLEALQGQPPWFTVGQIEPSQLDEDLSFCAKVRAAGLRIWCDLTIGVGHLTTAMSGRSSPPTGGRPRRRS
jgi:hypothetical protein